MAHEAEIDEHQSGHRKGVARVYRAGSSGVLPGKSGYTKKSYLVEAEVLIRYRYGVTSVPDSELRRLKADLYSGKAERTKRTKKREIPPD
jgi:hypothetical protein